MRRASDGPQWPITKRDMAGRGVRVRLARRVLAVARRRRRAGREMHLLRCAVALERKRACQGNARPAGHTACRTAIAGEDVSMLNTRAGDRAIRSGRRLDTPRDDGRAARRLVHAAMGRAFTRDELVVEEGGFPLDCDAITTTCRMDDGRRQEELVSRTRSRPRREIQLGCFRLAGRFREVLKAISTSSTRRAGPSQNEFSIGLHMRLTGHPGRAQGAGNSSPTQGPSRCVFARRIDIARHGWRITPDFLKHSPSEAVPRYRSPNTGAVRDRARTSSATMASRQGHWPGGARIAISLVVNTRGIGTRRRRR